MNTLRNGFLVLLTAMWLIACTADSPQKVADSYMKAVLNNDIDAVMATLYFDGGVPKKQQEMVRGKLAMVVEESSAKAQSLGGVKKISYSDTEYNQDKSRAKLVATVLYKNKDAAKTIERLNLIKTAKGWKISL